MEELYGQLYHAEGQEKTPGKHHAQPMHPDGDRRRGNQRVAGQEKAFCLRVLSTITCTRVGEIPIVYMRKEAAAGCKEMGG